METEEDSKSPIDPRWTFFLLAFTSVFREGAVDKDSDTVLHSAAINEHAGG